MTLVRVVAKARVKGSTAPGLKLVLLCAIDKKHRIVEGEWFGYLQTGAVFLPFIFQDRAKLFYGGNEHYYELTNIGKRDVKVGEFFIVTGPPPQTEKDGDVFKITSVFAVKG